MENVSAWIKFLDLINSLLDKLKNLIGWIGSKSPIIIRLKRNMPRLGIIEDSWKRHTWNYGTQFDKKVVILNTNWQITNTLSYHLTTFNVFLKKPQYAKGSVMLKDVNSQYWGHYTVPKGYTTEMSVSFIIDREHIKNDKSIIKAKLELQDPIGRIHTINSVLIYPIISGKSKRTEELRVEDASKINNKTERQVVAILKNEVQQYKFRGRKEGRLGTVDWPRGTIEYHDADKSIQYLFGNSSKTNVTSEHAEAMLKLHQKSSNVGRRVIVKSLTKRIDRKSEYCNVGYFIILCLFELGGLKEGLESAKVKLNGDKANGFSDVLRILDILLAFRYDEFKEADLELIEGLAYSTKESSFSIKERINAIRVKRMS